MKRFPPMKRALRYTGKNIMFIAERHSKDSSRTSLRVRDPRRPFTISFTVGRYRPNRKRSF